MATPYIAQQTVTDFGLRFADLKYSAKLAITTDTTLTIPGNAPRYKAVIKCVTAGEVWVAANATAAATAGTTFAASTSEMITGNYPICREVKAGDVLHFFSSTATTDVSVILYALGTNN
jgi:hypothetical protein